MTVRQFVAQIERLAAAVDASSPGGAMALADSVPRTERVAVGRDTIEVRLGWVRTGLLGAAANPKEWNTRGAAVAARLRAIAREASAEASARPAAARDVLERVLAARGFQEVRSENWQARLAQRVKDWLADLWQRTLGRRVAGRTVAVALAWTLSIAAVAVLLIWLTRLGVRRRTEAPVDLGRVTARRAAGRELALEAAALARAGRVREAVRVAYRAAVLRLEEEGALRADAARTPREYLRLLPSPHRRRPALAMLTETFERIWYGARVPAPGEGDAIVALLQELECLSRDHAS